MSNENNEGIILLELRTVGNWTKVIKEALVYASIGSLIGYSIGLIVRKFIK